MIATVGVSAVVAILVIVAPAVFLIIKFYPVRNVIFYRGVLEEIDCVDFISDKAELIYFFATPYKYRFRDEENERVFYFEATRQLPISAENLSGGYVPQTGHNILVTAWYNFFDELVSYKFERLPDWDPATTIIDPFVFPEYPDF